MNKIEEYLPIFILWLFHSILSVWFIFKDACPPAWDQSVHGILSSAYFHGSDILLTSSFYPPFFHLSVVPLYTLFGESFDIACCTNIIFLAILLFSVYGTGKVLFSRSVGLISALFISFVPVFINLQRDLLLDFPLVSMISLSLFLLLKTQNFKHTNYSVTFGVVFGLTLLTKWTGIFFMIVPIAWVIYQSIKEPKLCSYCNKLIKKKPIKNTFRYFCSKKHERLFTDEHVFSATNIHNFFGALVLFLLVAGVWYIPNIGVFSTLIGGQKHWGTVEGDPLILSLSSFIYYIKAANIQLWMFLSVLVLICSIAFFLKVDKDKKILFFFSLLVPYLIFTLTRNKDVRYTIPLLIFLALIVGYTVANINNKRIKSIVICSIIIFGIIQTSTITLGYPSFNTSSYIYPDSNQPKQDDWKIEAIFNIILDESNNSQQTKILVLYNHQYMNWRTLQYYSFVDKLPFLISNYEALNYDPSEILSCDFVLYVEEDIKATTGYGEARLTANSIFKSVIDEFELINKVKLPNEKELCIYKRRK